jgi:site-specific recombinase XerD
LTVARSDRGTPKSGKVRHLRLPTTLVPILRDWREHCKKTPEALVFPIGNRAIGVGRRSALRSLKTLLFSAGLRISPHPWHALRHTFASHFVMNGGNLLALQKILGHSDLKMTMIYAHLAPDFLDGEMEKVKF